MKEGYYEKRTWFQITPYGPSKIFHIARLQCSFNREYKIFTFGMALLGYGFELIVMPRLVRVTGA